MAIFILKTLHKTVQKRYTSICINIYNPPTCSDYSIAEHWFLRKERRGNLPLE